MKRSLMRPTAALFPAALLAAALMGNNIAVSKLFLNYCMIQLLSLCGVEAFRNAAAREPGVRRVDKRFSGTWIMILLGIAVTAVLNRFLYGRAELLSMEICLLIAVACINIEQLFEERMFALSHPSDGVILSIVSNVLLLAGLMIDSSGGVSAPVEGFYTACGAGLGMVISIAASYIIEPMHAFSLVPRNTGFFPKAAVQSLLYPAVMIGILNIRESGFRVTGEPDLSALFLGMILWRLSRTVCRRASDESRPLNLLLVAACGAVVIATAWFEPLLPYADGIIAAMVCAIAVFCAPGWRIYTGMVLVIAAWLMVLMNVGFPWITAIVCLIAIALNLHKAFLKKV